jgi:hypothetical protein
MHKKVVLALIAVYGLILVAIGLAVLIILSMTRSPLTWETAKISTVLKEQGITTSQSDSSLLANGKYIDLDGKDLPELVVGIESGGTAGITKVAVLRIDQAYATVHLVQVLETYKVNLAVEDNELKLRSGWYGVNDANCCAQAITVTTYRPTADKLELLGKKLAQVSIDGQSYLQVTNIIDITDQDYYYPCINYVFHSVQSFGKPTAARAGCPIELQFGNLKFHHQRISEPGPTDFSPDTTYKTINGKNGKKFVCWIEATYKYIGCDMSATKGFETYLTYYFPTESVATATERITKLLETADPVITK